MGPQARCLILFLDEDQMGVIVGRERENEQFQFLQEISGQKKLIPCGCVCAHWSGEGRPSSIWL